MFVLFAACQKARKGIDTAFHMGEGTKDRLDALQCSFLRLVLGPIKGHNVGPLALQDFAMSSTNVVVKVVGVPCCLGAIADLAFALVYADLVVFVYLLYSIIVWERIVVFDGTEY